MTEQEFMNKYVGKAVRCDTEEKAKELLKLADGFGWKWHSGDDLIKNTYWRFMGEKSCYEFDLNKTTGWSDVSFYKSKGYEIVEFENEEKKVKNTKKVFDLGLFVDYMKNTKRSNEEIILDIQAWALKGHGLTGEELNKKNLGFIPSWLKEVEVKVELTTQEVEALKALKVLGFNWIARDENDILYAYGSKPIKRSVEYGAVGIWCHLNTDLFSFITWQDEEPTSIDELLKNA